jgi:hypothetical protein
MSILQTKQNPDYETQTCPERSQLTKLYLASFGTKQYSPPIAKEDKAVISNSGARELYASSAVSSTTARISLAASSSSF